MKKQVLKNTDKDNDIINSVVSAINKDIDSIKTMSYQSIVLDYANYGINNNDDKNNHVKTLQLSNAILNADKLSTTADITKITKEIDNLNNAIIGSLSHNCDINQLINTLKTVNAISTDRCKKAMSVLKVKVTLNDKTGLFSFSPIFVQLSENELTTMCTYCINQQKFNQFLNYKENFVKNVSDWAKEEKTTKNNKLKETEKKINLVKDAENLAHEWVLNQLLSKSGYHTNGEIHRAFNEVINSFLLLFTDKKTIDNDKLKVFSGVSRNRLLDCFIKPQKVICTKDRVLYTNATIKSNLWDMVLVGIGQGINRITGDIPKTDKKEVKTTEKKSKVTSTKKKTTTTKRPKIKVDKPTEKVSVTNQV